MKLFLKGTDLASIKQRGLDVPSPKEKKK